MTFVHTIRKVLPILTVVFAIFFLVSGYFSNSFGDLIPGFSPQGFYGGLNPEPVISGTVVLGLGVMAGIFFVMTIVSFKLFD